MFYKFDFHLIWYKTNIISILDDSIIKVTLIGFKKNLNNAKQMLIAARII